MEKCQTPSPSLRFTPYAWGKLVFLRDVGTTEVGGFGISAVDDPLLVEDFKLLPQVCSEISVAFDDTAVADFFDEQVDLGLSPERFGRIWVHTHPGSSPEPSFTDEATFDRSFSAPDWALMFILARGGRSYARLRFRAGPGGQLTLRARVDYQRPFFASDQEAWKVEFDRCVRIAANKRVRSAQSPECNLTACAQSDLFHRELEVPWWML